MAKESIEGLRDFCAEQDPEGVIVHDSGWCGCAVGEYVAHSRGIPLIELKRTLSTDERIDLCNSLEGCTDRIELMLGGTLTAPQTYGEMVDFLTKELQS